MTITTDKAPIGEFIDDLTAKALTDPREKRESTPWERQLETEKPVTADDVLAAYLTGVHDGSTAVAHRWVDHDPASAIRYWAGPESLKRFAEEQEA